MHASYDKNAAIVVLPPVSDGRLENSSLRGWLAHADLKREPGPINPLAHILRELGCLYPEDGLGALRMWGQTGERPPNWIAAADAVYLEPRLDHLVLHALRSDVSAGDMRTLIDHLQSTLADDRQFGFTRVGSCCYVSAQVPFATSSVPASLVDNKKPDDYLPTDSGSEAHRRLLSEIEMALHEHEVNRKRETEGELPVNSLWLWGGGKAPDQVPRPQPPLYSDDALLSGYWLAGHGLSEPWRSVGNCLEQSVAGFVAEVPEENDDPAVLVECLNELRAALHSRRLDSLTLLFRDGLRAYVRRSHSLRVWRRDVSLLDTPVS